MTISYPTSEVKPLTKENTIIPAVRTPKHIAKSAFLNLIFSIPAATIPVYTPVVGIGNATNTYRPNNSYFLKFFILSKALFSNLSISNPSVLYPLK